RLAEADAHVLGRVVGAGLEVTLGLELQPQAAVAGEELEHVVEEADAGGDLGVAAVQGQLQADLRLLGLAVDLGCAAPFPSTAFALGSTDSAWTGKPSARASVATVGASSRAASCPISTVAIARLKTPGPSGPWKRPAPPVGRMWLEPAA